MKYLHKYGAKLFFGTACVLLIVALAFSGISFARYVSGANGGGAAGAASIDCSVNVVGGENTFVNAPYMQTVSGGNTQPVRMNNWADTKFSVENHGKHGLKYEYSFVFYMPAGFAENMMFQILKCDSNDVVTHASKLYSLTAELDAIEETTATEDGIVFENEYAELIALGGLLDLEGGSVRESGSESALVKTTFATSWAESGNGYIAGQLVSPVSFTTEQQLGYYRITVNLARSSRGVICDGDTHKFVLRTVLLASRNSSDYNLVWDINNYVTESGDRIQPSFSGDFELRWTADGTGLEAAEHNEDGSVGEFRKVNVGMCMGLGSPCKIAAVFTQTV